MGNYFGFRKLAGKGKMAPCSYINDATTDELGSLLLIKRKQGNEPKSKTGGNKRDRNGKHGNSNTVRKFVSRDSLRANDAVNPVLAGILYRSSSDSCIMTANNNASQPSQKAIARVAVGKGVRHGFVPQKLHQNKMLKNIDSSSTALAADTINGNDLQGANQLVTPSPVRESLNALTQNFNKSLHGAKERTIHKPVALTSFSKNQEGIQYDPQPLVTSTSGNLGYVPGSLHRDDSLVDLAMIPVVGDGHMTESNIATSTEFSFVDFPFESNFFSSDDPNI